MDAEPEKDREDAREIANVKGKIELEYYDADDLNTLLESLEQLKGGKSS